jgi:prolyl 4-hydroxylase
MAKTDMSVLKLVWCAGLIVFSWIMTGVHAELYTCLADMEELLETEALLMRTLDGYIQAQEEKLHVLRRLVNIPFFPALFSNMHMFERCTYNSFS